MEDKNSKSTNEVDTKDFKTDADRIRVQKASMSIYPEPTKISYAKTQEEIDKQAPVPKGDNSDLTTFNYDFKHLFSKKSLNINLDQSINNLYQSVSSGRSSTAEYSGWTYTCSATLLAEL